MSATSIRQLRRAIRMLTPVVERGALAVRHTLMDVENARSEEEAVIAANAVLARADALHDTVALVLMEHVKDVTALEVEKVPRLVRRAIEELEMSEESVKRTISKLSVEKYTSRMAFNIEKVCKPLGATLNTLSATRRLLLLAGLEAEKSNAGGEEGEG